MSPGGDIAAFYEELGIPLRVSGEQASTRCFASPDAHRSEDRHPSTSVSMRSGAWRCHRCSAHGGAYDAALTLGYTPRDAIELMIAHGLAERRERRAPGYRAPARAEIRPRATRPAPAASQPRSRPMLTVHQLAEYRRALAGATMLRARLGRERGWSDEAIRRLGLGLDDGRITIPAHAPDGQLEALLRYDPRPRRNGPKLLAAPGSARVLYPAPELVAGAVLVMVEGEPDAIAAHSALLPAVAIPGTSGWRAEWAARVAGGRKLVLVLADAEPDGRALATTVTRDLLGAGVDAIALDLHPEHDDGRDLTDWLIAHPARPVTIEQLRRSGHELDLAVTHAAERSS